MQNFVAVDERALSVWDGKHLKNKEFYAYSRPRKAPTVLQTYAHAQINNTYRRKGYSRESGKGIMVKKGQQFYIARYGN